MEWEKWGTQDGWGPVVSISVTFLCNEVPRYLLRSCHRYVRPPNLETVFFSPFFLRVTEVKLTFLNKSLHVALIFLLMQSRLVAV